MESTMSDIRIKTVFLAFLVLCSVLTAGCQDPVKEYGEGLIGAYESSQIAVEQTNLINMQRTVQMYRTANGKLPEKLEDVAYMMDSVVDYNKYQYDPQTGKVALKNR